MKRALAVAALVLIVVAVLLLLGRSRDEHPREVGGARTTPGAAAPAAPAPRKPAASAPGPATPEAPAKPAGAAGDRGRPTAGLARATGARRPGAARLPRPPAPPRPPPAPSEVRAPAPSPDGAGTGTPPAPAAALAAGEPTPATAEPLPAGPDPVAPPPPVAAAPSWKVPPDLTGAIGGVLRDRTARPIPLASVVAISADGSDAEETLTDDDGFFLLSGLRPGRYAVFAGLEGPLASQVPIRSTDVRPSEVSRLDLHERERGVTVRVVPRDSRGRVAEVQAVLVAGIPPEPGTFGSLLSAEAIYLPRPHSPRTVLADVPDGTYTLVILQGARDPIRAAWAPVRISGGREVVLDVDLGPGPRG